MNPHDSLEAGQPAPLRAGTGWFFNVVSQLMRLWSRAVGRGRRRSNMRQDGAHVELAVLRENDERFRWFVTSSSDLLCELRADGRLRYVSPNCEAITGYAPDELIGTSVFDIVHPEDRAAAAKSLVATLKDGGPLEFTARYLHKNGTYRWFEGYRQVYRKSPLDLRVVTIARDVTDRLAAQSAARQSEARLLLHIEQTPVAVIGWDADGKISSWNSAAQSIFGYSRDEMIGQEGVALLMPASQGHDAGMPHVRSHTMRENSTKDGRAILCEWTDTPLVAEEGSIVGVTSIVQEVTARVHAQEALRDSEAAIRSLYELTSAQQTDVSERIDSVLVMGCAFFHLPLALVARLDGDEVEVVAAHVPSDGVRPGLRRGDRFPLAATYSSRIVADGETVAIHQESDEFWASFALHAQAIVKSYIGSPVRVRGEIYGTISFAASEPRATPFTETEIDFIRLIAQWLGLALERQVIEGELRHNALHDALTGLPNQRLFYDRLQVAMAQAKRAGGNLAVCFVDLDRFKVVNDTLGHRVGDALLKQVTERLKGTLRDGDTLARLGGDEFVVLLPLVTDSAAAGKVAQRLLDSLEQPVTIDGREVFVTASVGVSLYPDAGTDPEALVKSADRAMYQAKEIGRDSYQIYAAAEGSTAERLELETSLRRAIKNDELRLYYQPQIDLSSNEIVGVEALVRWEHPERGLILPGHFIPLAEETGLILPIGAWVLEEACRQIAQWRQFGFPPVRVAVNVSARQFRHKGFVDTVKSVLDANGLEPGHLEIELTESVMMYAGEDEMEALSRLKFLGVRLAIDDFGTGYASLSNLKKFPVDVVKVDRSFVLDCLNSTDDAAIVKAVVSMGHALHLQVVAEGVETREQMAFLQLLGCDCAQGYLIGAPMPAAKFERLVAERSGAFRPIPSTSPAA